MMNAARPPSRIFGHLLLVGGLFLAGEERVMIVMLLWAIGEYYEIQRPTTVVIIFLRDRVSCVMI